MKKRNLLLCPICGSDKFWAGPEGGGGQDDVLCMQCGTEFIDTHLSGLYYILGRDAKRARDVYGITQLPEWDIVKVNWLFLTVRSLGFLKD